MFTNVCCVSLAESEWDSDGPENTWASSMPCVQWKQKSNCMKFIYLANNIQLGFRKFKSKFNFKFIFSSTGEKWEHSTRIVHANTQNAVARHCCAHVCECFFSSFNTKRNFALISFRPLATLQPKMENGKWKEANQWIIWPFALRMAKQNTRVLCMRQNCTPCTHSYLFGVSIWTSDQKSNASNLRCWSLSLA